jgi:hypothetical protein
MDTLLIIVLLFIIVFVSLIMNNNSNSLVGMENFDICENSAPADIATMGTVARDACNKISTRAEEIEAQYNGAANIAKNIPIASLFNPNNYRAGDNTTNDTMRNIINVNMSTCDIQKIENDCKNSSANMQTNIVDNSQCKWCATNECKLDGIQQTNAATINQRCVAQSAIETLLKKKNSIDAQALAKVLQKTENILSGNNTVTTENCNVLNTDLSTQKYLEDITKCANNLGIDQENSIKFCGGITDVIQDNQFKSFQDCLAVSGVKTTFDIESETKTKDKIDVEQESKGVDSITMFWIILIIIIVLLCLSSSSGAWFLIPMLKK